jgi:rhomboid protease GluP
VRRAALRAMPSMDSPNQERPFRVCPACGSLTPRPSPRCVVCGEPSVQAMAEEIERVQERRFAQVVFARATPVTWILIGANVAVFALMAWVAGTPSPESEAYQLALYNFGAKFNPLIDIGEWWRFVAPVFIHIGIIHLFVNMYSLSAIGPLIEQLYGSGRYFVLYLLTGIGGVAASYFFAPGNLSAGASTALFGLLGVLFVFGFRYRNELPGGFRHTFSPARLVPVLALNLFITFALPFIDKWGHLGGLFTGAVLALVVPYARTAEKRSGLFWWTAAGLCAAVVFASFTMVLLTPPRTAEQIYEITSRADGTAQTPFASPGRAAFIEDFNETGGALDDAVAAIRGFANDQDPPAALAGQARDAAGAARRAEGLDARSRALFERQAALLERASELLARGRSGVPRDERERFLSDADALERDWNLWAESEAEKHGLEYKRTNNNSGGRDGD